MFIKFILISAFVMSFAQAEPAEVKSAWAGFSRPDILASGLIHNFNVLPLQGAMTPGDRAWSGSYWAKAKGSINIRWNTPTQEGFDYYSPNREEVAAMSLEQLATLSPTEKYSLMIGDYKYTLKKEAARGANPDAEKWEGICHGWSPASLNHSEPLPKIITNPDGIQIPFGSSDIKGLLSWYYARVQKNDRSYQVGRRCTFGRFLGGSKTCNQDLNAGAFHIIAANMLGLRKEGFIADMDRLKQVWNHPVIGFTSTILSSSSPSRGAAKTAVKELLVSTDLLYVDESDNDSWGPAYGTVEQMYKNRMLKYTIELNAADEIVGGKWESETRPDFLWKKVKAETFEGTLSALPLLLNDI